MEYELGAPGKSYAQWAAKMAVGLGTGVPWVMCKQDDAPDPVVSLCCHYSRFFDLLVIMFLNFIGDDLCAMFPAMVVGHCFSM